MTSAWSRDQYQGVSRGMVLALVMILLVGLLGATGVTAAHASTPTVVSLTFDDGRLSAYKAGPILAAHNMHGTFYVNSSLFGDGYAMTASQVMDLYAAGNEIGGHTAHHQNLPQLDAGEAARQICYDRNNLLAMGIPATNFAYPFGAYDSSIEALVRDCGYNSARTVRAASGVLPPTDPYAIPIGTTSNDLPTLKAAVTAAIGRGGGWVPLMFHDVCSGCDYQAISEGDLSALLDWLAQQASNGVVVKTVSEVIGGLVQPANSNPTLPAAPTASSTLRNASMEYSSDGNSADCFVADNSGTNSYTWTRSADAHTGGQALRLDVTGFKSGDARLRVRDDLGACTPTVVTGHQYVMSTWYKSTAPVSFSVDRRTSTYGFEYWKSSPAFPATAIWTKASWVTPTIPTATNGLTFGLTLTGNGTLAVDDVNFTDQSSGSIDTTAPTVSVSSPSPGVAVAGTINVEATTSDNLAVDYVEFKVDGAWIATVVNGPVIAPWNTLTVANGPHVVSVKAVDTTGNSATATRSVYVSNQLTNLVTNASLEAAPSSTSAPTCWSLGGFGSNTFKWTRSTDAHTGGYSEAVDVTSWSSGDRKLVSAQDSGICAPTAIPGHSYSVTAWYKTAAPAYLFAYYRKPSGTWSYLSQSSKLPVSSAWRQASWVTPAIPTGATHVSIGIGITSVGRLVMDDFSMADTAPAPDTAAPTSTIQCDNSVLENSCDRFFDHPVQILLSASDDTGGSGVASIKYTTDGTTPTETNGNTYSGPFDTTDSVKWRAFDNMGNAERVREQAIHVDTNAPTTSMECGTRACDAASPSFSVSLSAQDNAGGSGVASIRYTTDGSDPTITVGQTYLGAFSVTENTTIKFRAYDNVGNAESVKTANLAVDTRAPSSAISCDGGPCSSRFYAGDVTVQFTATDGAEGSGIASTKFTTDGTDPGEGNGTEATAPLVLGHTTRLLFRSVDKAGNWEPVNAFLIQIDTQAPTTSITCNGGEQCSSDPYTSAVTVALAADDGTDGSGISAIRYTMDGSEPTRTQGQTYSGPFLVAGPLTVKYRAYDTAGNTAPVQSLAFDIRSSGDADQPKTQIACNDATCKDGYYTASVNVSISATQGATGSDIAAVRYTTDGTEPTRENGLDYTGSFPLSETATVKSRAYDVAGAVGPVQVTEVRIDATAPTVTAGCDGLECTAKFYRESLLVTLVADDGLGSGVASVRYTTDGSDPTDNSGLVYSGGFSIISSATVKYLATDQAGNVGQVQSLSIVVDHVPPTSRLECDGGNCRYDFYGAAVTAAIKATDLDGAGVDKVRYTTDGSDPTESNGNTYDQPITFTKSVTLKYRAYDAAGNAEPVNTTALRIDTEAPTTSAGCGGSTCSDGYYATAVSVSLSATDDQGGSGVDSTRYTVDGTSPTASSGTIYTGPFNVTTTTSIKYRSFDKAGNAEPVASSVIHIDTQAPTVALTSPTGKLLASGIFTLSATADDTVGVDHVDFLVDGLVVATDRVAPYSSDWNSASVSDASHSVSASAVDTTGNSASSGPVTVMVGNNNLVANGSLETGTSTAPSCWSATGYGTSSFIWARSGDAHSGSFGETLAVSSYTSGDRKLVTTQDSGTCAPSVAPGQSFVISSWYKSTVKSYVFVYYRTASGWFYWKDYAAPAAAAWTQSVVQLPAVPVGATNISLGMGINGVGTLTMDDFALFKQG